jgi:hypothetical protein
VVRGGRLGTLQLGASHCFPRACLHWGWRRAETYLDPLLLVGGGPIRLLPLWRDQPVNRSSPAIPSPPFARLVEGLLELDSRRSPRAPRSPPALPAHPVVRPLAMRPVIL